MPRKPRGNPTLPPMRPVPAIFGPPAILSSLALADCLAGFHKRPRIVRRESIIAKVARRLVNGYMSGKIGQVELQNAMPGWVLHRAIRDDQRAPQLNGNDVSGPDHKRLETEQE